MNAQSWYVAKLIGGAVLMWLLFDWGLPRLGIDAADAWRSMFMAMMVWGLWTLRRIANK